MEIGEVTGPKSWKNAQNSKENDPLKGKSAHFGGANERRTVGCRPP